MIEKPKKERRFLKTLGKIGEILIQEVLIKIGSNLIKKIGGKKTLPSILFLFASLSLFAQYPATGNKQRLGYQTTGDGLVFRGRTNDTTALKPSTINNAYFILDTVNNVLFNYIKTKGGWVFNNSDTVINNITVDTTSLSNRINLKLNISDTASMLTPYFKDADTTILNLTSRFEAKLNISDTASMLTNYLRTGVAASTYQAKLNGTGFVKASGTTISYDNSTYLTTGTAASTYLPLIGGTVSGTINRQEGSHDGSSSTFYYNILNYFAKRDNNKGGQTAQITFTDRPGTSTFENNVRTSDIYLMTAKNFSGGQLGQYLDTTLSIVANQDGGRVGISKLNPAYKLDVNGTFNASGNSLIGGTFGVTGATTLSAPLTVNSSAVFNEGSTDSDFRIESDGNVNMVFVDASTDRVGIGTNAPSKTLEVNGEVRIATVTATPTALLGKDGSNVVGELGLGTGMSVGSGILSVQAAGASATGLVTSFGSQTFGGNKTFNGTVTMNDELNLSSGYLKRGYLSSTSTSITVGDNDTWLNIHQDAEVTVTLPAASSYTGRELIIKQTGSGVVTSASTNIIGFTTAFNGSTQTAIINPANYRFATLVSDGTNWVIMQRNN